MIDITASCRTLDDKIHFTLDRNRDQDASTALHVRRVKSEQFRSKQHWLVSASYAPDFMRTDVRRARCSGTALQGVRVLPTALLTGVTYLAYLFRIGQTWDCLAEKLNIFIEHFRTLQLGKRCERLLLEFYLNLERQLCKTLNRSRHHRGPSQWSSFCWRQLWFTCRFF